MKKKFVCQNCGKEYESYKENSKHCSKECRKAFNQRLYSCDYCGKEIIINKSRIDDLINGKHKRLYCSKECANKGQISSSIKNCCYCNKPFESIKSKFDTARFCSKDCYDNSRNLKIKLQQKICPICNTAFSTYHKAQKFCSIKCSGISMEKRQKCACNTCGKEINKKFSDIVKSEKHFCSFECRVNYNQWNEKDLQILKENYRKIKTSYIQTMLSKPYSIDEIKRKAAKIGATISRKWSEEETDILIKNYPTKPMSDLLQMLPKRTLPSVIGKARVLNLQSYFYTTRVYSQQDIQYLRENYLTKSNEELAERLGRDINSVAQKLCNLNLYRPHEYKKDGYKDLEVFVRSKLQMWKQSVRELNNYTCCITGRNSNLVIHHCRSFNLLFQETIDNMGFVVKDNFTEYTDSELSSFVENFLNLQAYYGEYVCIYEPLHRLFHKYYGYGDNTMNQWIEFVDNYCNGLYEEIA